MTIKSFIPYLSRRNKLLSHSDNLYAFLARRKIRRQLETFTDKWFITLDLISDIRISFCKSLLTTSPLKTPESLFLPFLLSFLVPHLFPQEVNSNFLYEWKRKYQNLTSNAKVTGNLFYRAQPETINFTFESLILSHRDNFLLVHTQVTLDYKIINSKKVSQQRRLNFEYKSMRDWKTKDKKFKPHQTRPYANYLNCQEGVKLSRTNKILDLFLPM